MDPFEELPDEVLLKIFRHVPQMELPHCAMVCSRWRNLVCDHSLWTRVTIDTGIPFEALATILQRGVVELRVFGWVENSQPPKKSLFPPDLRLPLRVLVIQTYNPKDEVRDFIVNEILSRTSELVQLSIHSCPLRIPSFEIIGRNPNLEVLDLFNCYNIPESFFPGILQRCKGLKELILECATLHRRTVLDSLIMNLHSNVVRLNLWDASDCLCDADLPKIFEKCPNLERLYLSYNSHMTPRLTSEAVARAKELHPQVAFYMNSSYGSHVFE